MNTNDKQRLSLIFNFVETFSNQNLFIEME